VFKEPCGKGGVVMQLPPLTTVTLIETKAGWAQIARDGKALGYVRATRLQPLGQPTAAPAPGTRQAASHAAGVDTIPTS